MVRKNTILAKEEATGKEVPTCHHYWVIDSPEGPTSRGVCKFCGAVKEFYNSWAALGNTTWTRSSTPHARRATVPAADIEPEETEPEEVSKEYTDEDWEDES